MNDQRKSLLLRALLFAIATIIVWIVVGAADIIIYRAHLNFFGEAYNKSQIENMVFLYVTSRIMWRWLSRRVWIGLEERRPSPRGEQ